MTGTSDGETVSKSMTYTPGGMMETYSDGERVQQNTYIGGETRIRKEEGTSLQNLTDITNYFYQEGSVLYTTDYESNPESFNLLNISDIFGTERTDGSDEYYYFYLNDIRGSKTGLIDSTTGSIVSYWYNDFGEVSEERSDDYEDFINEVQYTGAIYDVSTGLLYLNARFYDSSTGRFISQDSYRGERDEPGTWHLYAYCVNDPVNHKDLTGNNSYYLQDISDADWERVLNKWYSKIPTKNNHYGRNVKNINLPKNEDEAISDGYKPKGKPLDNCHQFTAPTKRSKRNKKYVSKNGRKEVIFDYTGKHVVTDDRDIGTYNNGKGIFEHFWKDVIPYFKWGNTKKDSTTRKKRMNAYGLVFLPYPKYRVDEVLDSLPD